MVEGGIIPIGGAVTGSTIGAESAAVLIVLLVAGKAIGGRAFVDVVGMTIFATCFGVLAFKFEGCEVVVEGGGCPGIGCMARGTVVAEAALVWFIFAVTGGAVHGQVGEIGKRPGVGMTVGAALIGMLAGKTKIKVVVKPFVKTIHTIVTGKTIVAVFE